MHRHRRRCACDGASFEDRAAGIVEDRTAHPTCGVILEGHVGEVGCAAEPVGHAAAI